MGYFTWLTQLWADEMAWMVHHPLAWGLATAVVLLMLSVLTKEK
jgi:hypothetical protein